MNSSRPVWHNARTRAEMLILLVLLAAVALKARQAPPPAQKAPTELTIRGLAPGLTYREALEREQPTSWEFEEGYVGLHYPGETQAWFKQGRAVAVIGHVLERKGRVFCTPTDSASAIEAQLGSPLHEKHTLGPNLWWRQHNLACWSFPPAHKVYALALLHTRHRSWSWETDPWANDGHESYQVEGISLGMPRPLAERARRRGTKQLRITYSTSGHVVAVQGSNIHHYANLSYHNLSGGPLSVGQPFPAAWGLSGRGRTHPEHGVTVHIENGVITSCELKLPDPDLLAALGGPARE